MRRWLVGMVLIPLITVSAANAQVVRIGVAWPGPRIVAGVRYARPIHVQPVRRYCEPHGPVLYCWDVRSPRVARPTVVYVYGGHAAYLAHYRKEARKAAARWWHHQHELAERRQEAWEEASRGWEGDGTWAELTVVFAR